MRVDRRTVLRSTGAAGALSVASLSGCFGEGRVEVRDGASTARDADARGRGLADVRGAVYFPSRSFNHYQAWARYDPGEVARDLAFARALNLNALRVLVSYEYWQENPEMTRRKLDHFFESAAIRDIRLLPVFFESIGKPPTRENLTQSNVLKAGAISSPGARIIKHRRRWREPRRFVTWFAERYGGHDGLLAIEIMNEPGEWKPRVNFCRSMLRAARAASPTVPLTMGCKGLEYNRQYRDPALDVYQFHYNVPPTKTHMRRALREAAHFSRADDVPVWLTEWQRTRVEPPNKMRPNYSSLAPVVRAGPIEGEFFWQLMLKPAYGAYQRLKGRLNGIFHEDGAVYSLDDARSIAEEGTHWDIRKAWPEWAREIERRAGG